MRTRTSIIPSMHEYLAAMWRGVGGDPRSLANVELAGKGELPSVFAVSDFATAAVGAAGMAVAELVGQRFGTTPRVSVDRRLALLWYGWSMRPQGWEIPAVWDPIAGDYPTRDGWIRLHTNAPHHREAALAVLGVPAEKERVMRAVVDWRADDLEAAVVERGGCAATMRDMDEWKRHPQWRNVSAEPLVEIRGTEDGSLLDTWPRTLERPLRGLRVLDLTRVLAGPVATRFLAAFGADVLRIDPLEWDEPGVIPEVTLGKRCARLDLRASSDRATFQALLKSADVLVHGYRANALERLGFGPDERRALRPGLIDVCLNAYGWTGPWRNRRGFDSLVQMSAGIAEAGMRVLGKGRPTPLPVQALDHATGYLLAAAVLRGVTHRLSTGRGFEARASLARTAELLMSRPVEWRAGTLSPATDDDFRPETEASAFGPMRRLVGPVSVGAATMHWDHPAARLGSSPPEWPPG